MKEISIVYSTNDLFAPICAVSISSIIHNASKKYKYGIYIFHTRLSKVHIKKLEEMTTSNVIIKCININKYIDFSSLYEIGVYSYEIYYRYFIPIIVKKDKVIYLDCDTIVLDDISKLYNEKIDKSLGAIMDYCNYYRKYDKSINSGVLVFSCKRFEELKIREKCLDLIRNNTYELPDQTALNIICKNEFTYLHPKYNYQMHAAYINKFKRNAVKKKYENLFNEKPLIIHYSYLTKPHYSIFSKYNKDFWIYAKETSYYEELVDEYLSNPYKVIKSSPIDEIFMDLIYEGKIGMRRIISVFFTEVRYWVSHKIRGNDDELKK